MTTHAISVPTPFNEINELAESFAPRVDEERIMLPHYEDIPVDEWVRFEVTFADGAPALSGTGRCSASYDAGEEREPEQRFDIVLEELALDEMAQVYFERVLIVRQQQASAEPITGQVEVPEELVEQPMAAEPVADEPLTADAVSFDEELPSEPEPVRFAEEEPAPASYEAPLSSSELELPEGEEGATPRKKKQKEPERLAPPVAAIYALPPPTAPGQLPTPHGNGTTLTRRWVEASWSPEPMERPEPSPSTGYFQYGIGVLPRPAAPPRPQLDASLRVMPAPRPGDPHTPMIAAAAYDAPEADFGADETMQVEADEEDY